MLRNNHQRYQCCQGFTLVELLVAIVIFSLIGLGSWQVLSQATRAEALQAKKVARLTAIYTAFNQLQEDLSFAIHSQIRTDQYSWQPAFSGDTTAFEFVRLKQMGIPEHLGSELLWGQYQLEDSNGFYHLIRQSSPLVDGFDRGQTRQRTILSRLNSLHIEYLDTDAKPHSVWPENRENPDKHNDQLMPGALPAAVRITLDIPEYGEVYRIFETQAKERQGDAG